MGYDFFPRHRIRYIILLTPTGVLPRHEKMLGVMSSKPWIRPLNLNDSQIIAYSVSWPGEDDIPEAQDP